MNKIYSYFLFLLLVCTSLYSNAQTYGNEWIKYDQQYYGFKVAPRVSTTHLILVHRSHLETGFSS